MKLINNSTNPLAHGGYKLLKGEKKEVPDKIAKEWLKIPGVEEYIAPADLKKAQKEAETKAKAEKEALEKELQSARAEIADLKKAQKEAETKAKSSNK